jgi:site-specific recombinase XerD
MNNRNSSIITKAGRHVDQIGWDKVLTQKEQQQVRKYLDSLDETDPQNWQMKMIYELMIKTGLRVGELAALRLKDCPAYLGVNAIFVFRGKGNKDRTIPISKQLCEELRAYIDEVRPKTLQRWARKGSGTPVFCTFKKTLFVQVCKIKDKKTDEIIEQHIRASSTLYRMITCIGQQAGITKTLHPHMLRHTFAVNALMKGVNIYTLMTLMGHTSITTTTCYLHLAAMQMDELGEVLGSD